MTLLLCLKPNFLTMWLTQHYSLLIILFSETIENSIHSILFNLAIKDTGSVVLLVLINCIKSDILHRIYLDKQFPEIDILIKEISYLWCFD